MERSIVRKDAMTTSTQIQGKRAELTVFQALLERGTIPYLPLTDAEGVDAIVSVGGSRLLRIQIKARGFNEGIAPKRLFRVDKLKTAHDFFVVCVEASGRDIGNTWVFPSIVFDAYARRDPNGVRDLDLDMGKRKYGQPLHEILCGFRNRWELITEYESFKDLFGNPEDLEDVLTMREALETPGEEMMTWDECERFREAQI